LDFEVNYVLFAISFGGLFLLVSPAPKEVIVKNLFLSALLVVSAFGCGNKDEKKDAPPPPSQELSVKDNACLKIANNKKHGGYYSCEDENTFFMAAVNGDTKVVGWYLDAGFDINMMNSTYTSSVLHIAALNNYTDLIKMLLERGADLNLKDRNGFTPIMQVGKYASLQLDRTAEKIRTLKVLIAAGAEVNDQDNEGNTLLMYLVKGAPSLLKYFVENTKDIDFELRNKDGDTALSIAEKSAKADQKYLYNVVIIRKAMGLTH
jgi:ankyrin repeat protein